MKTVSLIGLLIVLLPSPALAATRYVAVDGSTSNDCTSEAAPCTLYRMMQVWGEGDYIRLFGGEYPADMQHVLGGEHAPSFFPNNVTVETYDTSDVVIFGVWNSGNDVTVRGAPGHHNLKLDGRAASFPEPARNFPHDCATGGGNNFLLENFECKNFHMGVNVTGDGTVVRNGIIHTIGHVDGVSFCDVSNDGGPWESTPGLCHGAYISNHVPVRNPTIYENLEFFNIEGYGIHCTNACNGFIFRNIRSYNNRGPGFFVQGTDAIIHNAVAFRNGGHGFSLAIFDTNNAPAYNIVSHDNGGAGVCLIYASQPVRNAIVLDNESGGINYTDCHELSPGVPATESNNITAGDAWALFVNPNTGATRGFYPGGSHAIPDADYHLVASASMAIDMGTTQIRGSRTGQCPSTPVADGEPLLVTDFSGACPEIGAYEETEARAPNGAGGNSQAAGTTSVSVGAGGNELDEDDPVAGCACRSARSPSKSLVSLFVLVVAAMARARLGGGSRSGFRRAPCRRSPARR
jgi:hypothetical protein